MFQSFIKTLTRSATIFSVVFASVLLIGSGKSVEQKPLPVLDTITASEVIAQHDCKPTREGQIPAGVVFKRDGSKDFEFSGKPAMVAAGIEDAVSGLDRGLTVSTFCV